MNYRRHKIREEAALLGIDEAYIDVLVETFYGRIQEHAELGPVFERAIGDRWSRHLQQMKLFWASVTLNSGVYSGKPILAHLKHKTIKVEHFDSWLSLFEKTLQDTGASQEAVDYFMVRANRIAKSLKLAMFGHPDMEFLEKHG